MCVAANASKLFCMINLANIERFLSHSNFSFKKKNCVCMEICQLELTKPTQVRERAFSLGNEGK